MRGRILIISSIVLYVVVALGCVLSGANDADPTAVTPIAAQAVSKPLTSIKAERRMDLPFRGVSMQLHRVDWLEEYKKSVDEIASLGADTLQLVVDSRMENGGSARIYLDMRLTPDPQVLGSLIDHAKSKGLRVVLMPIVLLDNPRGMEWRGTINPADGDWAGWWQSYRSMLYHYSWIAETHKVDVLVVGSELVSTEKKADEWRKTISQVRETFKGMLTYSANWDHYKDIPFWEQLDLIGMNSYWWMGANAQDRNPSVEVIQQRWGRIQEQVLGFARSKGKPLMFTEVGLCSIANAAHEPWDYTKIDEPLDLELQRKLYEAFFRSWHGKPGLGGFSVWEWPPGEGGRQNRGYTPEGKPAEQVLREWMAKPRWQVQ